MPRLVALFLALFKWPVAIATLILTPAAIFGLWGLLKSATTDKFLISPFAIGFLGMFGASVFLIRTRFVQFWATLEHELTHALFAWLTFVRVTELWTSDGSRASTERPAVGMVVLEGDNWLISVSPYFFPTAAAALIAATWILAAVPTTAASALIGCATGWCVVSTLAHTHQEQSDLRAAGIGFSLLLLPGANTLCYGLILANELGGPARAWAYAASVPTVTVDWVRGIM